jgi:CheY-like chemotaxis protein
MTAITPLRAETDRPPVALLVDRDADTRRIYAEYLKRSFCIIEEADDGRAALAKAISGRPDIIVTETQLPGMSGLDLCSLLRQDAATRAIPIVVVTSDVFEVDLTRAWKAGADAVLAKPCRPEALLAEIQSLLQQSASLRERAGAIREKMRDQLAKSDRLIERSRAVRRQNLSSLHSRHETTTPPVTPPVLECPLCDQPLRYLRSHIGGVSARYPEQWDYFECNGGCGEFQYRVRTRKLRKV